MAKISLFDIPILNVTRQEAVSLILRHLAGENSVPCFFVNAHCINVSRHDLEYFRILHAGGVVFADGVGMKIAAWMHGKPLCDNVNGTDLYPLLLKALESTGLRIFLLGGDPGVAEEMQRRALKDHPDLIFCGTHPGFFSPEENASVVQAIQSAQPDLLLVAMGVPRQEKWIAAHLKDTGAKVGIGVGGLFNFYAGMIPRAPGWMRRIGLEWLHRLWMEPGRLWKRYLLGNIQFLWFVVWTRIRKNRSGPDWSVWV